MEFRYPKITEKTTQGQLIQMQEFMHQLTNQLNFALKSVKIKEKEYSASALASASSKPTNVKDNEAEDTFFKLKNMIVKSADIVNAYYDIITMRLKGEYSALSDFGSYTERLEKLETETAKNDTEFYNSLKSIEDELGNKTIRNDGFYIKTGYLDDNNTIGGIELGKMTTVDGVEIDEGFARFTTGELVFYGGGGLEDRYVVARFSKNTMHINEARINGNAYIKNYFLDTSNGLAFKWTGGDA